MPMLKLSAEPTFKAKVPIPVPGSDPAEVEMEFKHRTKDDLAKFNATSKERSDVDSVLQTVVSWGFEDKFNKVNVERLLQNYHGAAAAIATTYLSQLMAFRLGNSVPSLGGSTK